MDARAGHRSGDDAGVTLRREGLLAALVAVVITIALLQSWNRWLDPIIDTGRDLYISERLFHGTTLYRDIRYQYPPLAPYLLAVATALAGASLGAFTAIGIAQSLVIAALLWIALRGSAGFAAALLFAALSFTGASTWGANFVFPYAYAATIGMLFLVAALAAFVRQRVPIAIVALVAASWCKIEYAAAAMLIIAVLVMGRRLRIGPAVAYAIAMIVIAVAALAVFGEALRDNVFASSLTKGETARQFFRNVSGFAAWPHNLGVAIASAAAVALIAWLFRSRSKLAIPAVIIAACFFNSDSFMRGWAILQFIALFEGFRRRNSPLIYFAIFSIASTLRVALHVSPQWYGCALVVPAYALVAYVLFESEYRSSWWFAIIAIICARDLYEQHERFAVKSHAIATQRGTFYDYNPDRAKAINELIASIHGPTLAVFPEGASINYFTRTPTPLSYYMFTPPETADRLNESAVLAELRSHAPAEVVLLSRDVSEYGSRGFGVDYDRDVSSYIIQKYRVERSWSSSRFQAALLHMSP
jgi:hypothetical protein